MFAVYHVSRLLIIAFDRLTLKLADRVTLKQFGLNATTPLGTVSYVGSRLRIKGDHHHLIKLNKQTNIVPIAWLHSYAGDQTLSL